MRISPQPNMQFSQQIIMKPSYAVIMNNIRKKYLTASIFSAAICAFLGFMAFAVNSETAQFILAAVAGGFLALALVFAIFWDAEKIG